jgi:hypothetical protein
MHHMGPKMKSCNACTLVATRGSVQACIPVCRIRSQITDKQKVIQNYAVLHSMSGPHRRYCAYRCSNLSQLSYSHSIQCSWQQDNAQ